MPIRVSLVEDSQGLRESLVALLRKNPELICAGAHATAEEAIQKIPAEKADVVLMDIHLPGMNGVECVAWLKARLPHLRILVLTLYEQSDLIFRALREGADGYLLKCVQPRELIQAVKQVHAGGSPMSMLVARKVIDYFRKTETSANRAAAIVQKLTPREHEILELLAKGYLYREIAGRLGLSFSTVRAHLHSIYKKLHVRSRTEAVIHLQQ